MTPEEEYLQTNQLSVYFEDVISNLLNAHPEDPVEFIAEYFAKCKTGANTLHRNFDYVSATFNNRVRFVSQFKSTMKAKQLFSCFELQQLLQLVCPNFPLERAAMACKIHLYGSGQLADDEPSFEYSEVHLRESGIGKEQLHFGDFCKVLQGYLAYHGMNC